MKLIFKEQQKIIKEFILKKNIFKKSESKKILIITNFSEFGVETLACLYSIPVIKHSHEDYKIIIVGWSGREYLYRHLAHEFWELDKKFYELKDFSNAFVNNSKNIKNLEKELSKLGKLISTGVLGNFFVAKTCKICLNSWKEDSISCNRCGSKKISLPILETLDKSLLHEIPLPPEDNKIKKLIPKNSVAIFARNRKTYGRNLPKEFYLKLNQLLKKNNLVPIYLGENSTTLNMEDCLDFSKTKNVDQLEFTLNILLNVKFSIQFWTASTRLSSITKTPFILVESPDQMAYVAQELQRIALTTDFNKKKIIISHYIDFVENQEEGLSLIQRAITELNDNNWDFIMGMAKNKSLISSIIKNKGLDNW